MESPYEVDFAWQAAALSSVQRVIDKWRDHGSQHPSQPNQATNQVPNHGVQLKDLAEDLATLTASRGVGVAFEGAGPQTRVRLCLAEFVRVLDAIERREALFNSGSSGKAKAGSTTTTAATPPPLAIDASSDLFDSPLYTSELALILVTACCKMPNMLTVPKVTKVLANAQTATTLLVQWARMQPSMVQTILGCLLRSSNGAPLNAHANPTQLSAARVHRDVVTGLLALDPSLCWSTRRTLVQERILPDLVMELSSANWCDDEVSMCCVLLVSESDWIKQNHQLGQAIYNVAERHLESSESLTGTAAARLGRLFCLMLARITVIIAPQDLARLLRLVRGHIHLSLSLVCLLPKQLETEEPLLSFLQMILSDESKQHDFLPWILDLYSFNPLHHTELTPIVSARVRETLGIVDGRQLQLAENQLRWLHQQLVVSLISRETLAKLVLSLPPVEKLAKGVVHAPILQAVHNLIVSGALRNSEISPLTWLLAQLRTLGGSVDPRLQGIMQQYATSGLPCFSEKDVLSIFDVQPMERNLVAKSLVLYYVLLYNNYCATPQLAVHTAVHKPYPLGLVNKLSLRAILLCIEQHANRSDYESILPPLTALAVSQYPHYFGVDETLHLESSLETLASYREIQLSFENTAACILVPDEYLRSPPVPALTKALSSIAANRESAQAVFKWLATLGPLELRPFRSLLLSTALPQLVEPGVPRTLLDSYYAVWRLLSIVEPAAVWLDTWIAFSPATASDTDKLIASIDALQQNPLLVLQCRKHVLECPTLYAMLLQCLKGWIVGNHRWLASLPGPRAKRDGVTAAAATTKSINSVAGKTTLEIMQASAIVQMLLEVCQPLVHAKTAAANGENIGHWEEIAAMTCQFLHQLFIDFDNSARAAEVASTLPRLVHYQGYDLALLSLTVNGVASMHVCFDFLPELINSQYRHCVVFAAHLTAHLALKYPIASSLEISRSLLLVLDRKAKSGSEPIDFWTQVLPALPILARAFPVLSADITAWLQVLAGAFVVDNFLTDNLLTAIDQTIEDLCRVMLDQPAALVLAANTKID